jgi:YD repeat-containing protein
MSKRLTCPFGHEWETTVDDPGTAASEGCPVCGRRDQGPSTTADPYATLPNPSVPAADSLRPWPQVPGYEVFEEVGKGGMGVVYKARQVKLNRVVAVKMVRGAAHADQETLLRFLREAELAARLQHVHFVQVHEVGVHEGCPFFSMELIEGGSLARRLQEPVEPWQAAVWLEVLARAMHHAHHEGIVHRDLKPANVLLTADGMLKVTDFGLAKTLAGPGGLTQTGAVMGTPAYMAPEQAGGKTRDVGPAADVYALGAILYECLAGRPPFQGERSADVLVDVLTREPAAPSRLRRGVPRDLETICLKCLEKDPARRYASAQELADDLGRYLRDEPIRARRTSVWRRGVKWARRRPATAAALALVGLLLLGGAWYWDRYERVRVEYYVTSTYRRGVPEGVGGLTEEQVRHRSWSLKQYRRGGRIEKQEFVDGQGRLTTRAPRTTLVGLLAGTANQKEVCRIEFRYHEEGRVTEQIALDRAGAVVWTFHHDTADGGHFSDPHGYVRGSAGSGAAHVEFTWSPEGYLQAAHFRDAFHKPQPVDNGSFGVRFDLDPRGLAVRATYLGADGKPAPCKQAYTTMALTYDALGNHTEMAFLDAQGRPALCRDGYHRETLRYDAWGNLVEWTYVGLDGNPALHRDGNAGAAIEYDGQGNPTRVAFRGRDGAPTLVAAGFTAISRSWDVGGNMAEETYLGLDGRPTPSRSGVATVRMTHDDRGKVLEQAYFDRDGKPALHADGYARRTMAYDDAGNRTEEAYFGLDGGPTACKEGYAREALAYDANGNRIEQAFFDAQGQPALSTEGFARQTTAYDDRGNPAEDIFFGRDGRRAAMVEGYARRTRSYDTHGNRTEEACFNADGQPTPCRGGFSRVSVEVDARGNPVVRSYYDRDGHLTSTKDGYARYRTQYDVRGHVTEETYFGPDGKPTLHVDGMAKVTYVRDGQGNATEMAYFDQGGKPVMSKTGFARTKAAYDERGHVIDESWFDEEGRPVNNKNGYARREMKLNAQGLVVEMAYFGPDGKPAAHKMGNARFKVAYDERGHRTEEAYFDQGGRPVEVAGVHRVVRRYNPRGNCVETSHLDREGRLVFSWKDGCARMEQDFDDRGNCTRVTRFGPDGKPDLGPEGFASWTARHDDRGHLIEKFYFDAEGKRSPAWPDEHWTYDDRGNPIEIAYTDEHGKPLMNREKLARQTGTFDDRGNRVLRAYFDENGRPTADWSQESLKYDERGNVVEFHHLDGAGKLVRTSLGNAGWTGRYDGRGNILERTYFDADWKPVAGAARQVIEYDNRGNPVRFSYFTGDGKRALYKGSYFSLKMTYDGHDNLTDAAYFDRDDRPLSVEVVLTAVAPGRSAARLGLQPGDVIEKYDGKPPGNYARFLRTRDAEPPGGPEKELVVRRQEQRLTFRVPPGKLGMNVEDHILPAPAGGP